MIDLEPYLPLNVFIAIAVFALAALTAWLARNDNR